MTMQEIRADLKRWEHWFQEKHSRVPTKADVHACASIQKLYFVYSKLKSELGKQSHPLKTKTDERTGGVTEITDRKRISSRDSVIDPLRPVNSCQAAPSSDSVTNSQVCPDQAEPEECFPGKEDQIPSCASVLERGSVIQMRRHGSHFDSNECRFSDDPLPAGFRSTFGPSSLLSNSSLQSQTVFSLGETISRDGDDARLDPGPTAQPNKLMKQRHQPKRQKVVDDGIQGAGGNIRSVEDAMSGDDDEAKPNSYSTVQLDAGKLIEQTAQSVRQKHAVDGTQSSGTNTRARQKVCSGSAERDNFVRMNLNGRCKKKRKFVNGARVRRTCASGRRKVSASKYRKRHPAAEAVDEASAQEINAVQARGCEAEKRSDRAGDRNDSIWLHDGWLERGTCNPVDERGVTSGRSEELTGGLKDAVEAARKSPSEKNLLEVLYLGFSFSSFRAGQLEAIKRVVSSRSTMVVLPTGSGKSLCYQLPAYILPGVILVISPLVALMADQLNHLPPSLPGALISSSQTPQESSATVDRLRAGQAKILFISPERLCSESFHSIVPDIPKISLAVIDEAHCLSEWSHNFRPSYYRLGKVLLEKMNVSCILAMSATATKKAAQSILRALCIPSDGVVQNCHVRDNLLMSVSSETNRCQALLSMLQRSPYLEAKSIIVYCTFQAETDRIAELLQKNSIQAKSYHSAKPSSERSRVHELFCKNKLRVVVATVAFGMGLDKSDVRAIVHLNMPRSLESYVQETGRAGRDGQVAHCHLFLDTGDYLKLRSLAYSDGVDEYSVNKFLSLVFKGHTALSGPDTLGSIVVESTTRELDMKEEVMETILSYLEVGDVQYVKVFSKLNAVCTLGFHKSSPAVLAHRNTFLAAVVKRSAEKQGRYIFDISAVASEIRCSLLGVQSELRRLQNAGEITYETSKPALCFAVKQIPADICLLTSEITARLREGELCKIKKLDAMYSAASAALQCVNEQSSQQDCSTSLSPQQASLQAYVQRYFQDEDTPDLKNLDVLRQYRCTSFVQADIKVFLKSARSSAVMTGRAVARIFHGLWSPAFPYAEWSKNHFWGRHAGVDFEVIKQAAAAEILNQYDTNQRYIAS